jgi:hypothetical protein
MTDPFNPGRQEGVKVGYLTSTITEGVLKSSAFWQKDSAQLRELRGSNSTAEFPE